MAKPYVIVSPDYNPTSGGIKVMWGLYGWLLAKGQEVYMNRVPQGKEVIAIYPEIQHGNPVMAKTVVRYLLNKPGVMCSNGTPGPTTYDPTDRLYVFSELFNVVGADADHHLFLPIIDLHTFTDKKRKRTKKAVFGGKGQMGTRHPKDCIGIERDLASDQGQLADLLNKCEVLYGYDPVSAMYECARLCGCRVVIIPSTYTKSEFEKYEPGMNGISWGKDEGIMLDSREFRNHYIEMVNLFDAKLDLFIESTQL